MSTQATESSRCDQWPAWCTLQYHSWGSGHSGDFHTVEAIDRYRDRPGEPQFIVRVATQTEDEVDPSICVNMAAFGAHDGRGDDVDHDIFLSLREARDLHDVLMEAIAEACDFYGRPELRGSRGDALRS